MAKLTLAAMLAATATVYATKADAKALVDAGHAEINPNIANPDNAKEFAVRLTDAGKTAAIDAANAGGDNAGNRADDDSGDEFEIETVPADFIGEKRRRGAGESRYPFDKLGAPVAGEALSAFFVPATAKMPEPWNSLSSAMSAAARRHAKVTGTKPAKDRNGVDTTRNTYEHTRKFAAKEGERKGVKGAWVARTL